MERWELGRIPTDLWKDILELATQWLILPGTGDDIWNLAEAWDGCHYLHLYQASISFRTNLRLVCRSWNDIVNSLYNHLVLTDFETIYWPSNTPLNSASCISASDDAATCQCGGSKPSILEKWNLSPSSTSASSSKRPTELNDDLEETDWTVRAVHFSVRRNPKLPYRMMDRLPFLQLLTWVPHEGDDTYAVLGRLKYLTHLRLEIGNTKLPPTQDLYIPTLKHLRLGSEGATRYSLSKGSISNWTLPNLSLVEIVGDLDRATTIEIERFLCKVGSGLTGFSARFRCFYDRSRSGGEGDEESDNGDGQWVVEADQAGGDNQWEDVDDDIGEYRWWRGRREIWDSFTNLSVVGVSQDWFVYMAGIPQGLSSFKSRSNPLTIYICDMHCMSRPDHATKASTNFVKWCKTHPTKIERIAMQQSWEGLASHIIDINEMVEKVPFVRGNNVLPRACRFAKTWITELENSGFPFCDREGVYLGGEEMSWFLEALVVGFSPTP